MSTLIWLKNHWYIPLTFLGALALFVLGVMVRGQPTSPVESTKKRLEVIDEGTKVQKIEAEHGALEAKKYAMVKYAQEKEKLDGEQKQQAEELKDDPKKLSQFLVKAGHSSS